MNNKSDRIMKWLVNIASILSKAGSMFGGFLIIILPFAIFYDVLSRFVFNIPTYWMYDFVELLIGVVIYIGYSYVVLSETDVRVNFLYDRLPFGWKKYINLIGGVISIGYLCIVALLAIDYWWRSYISNWTSFGPARYPLWIPLGFFAVGLGLVLYVEIMKRMKFTSNIKEVK
jgi:TRAP-type C4-dicarboxylate transport system permease small subunit